MEERFPYGSYVEGFIQLHSQTDVSLSVPFLGFYGAFGEAPVLEEGAYESLMGGGPGLYHCGSVPQCPLDQYPCFQ